MAASMFVNELDSLARLVDKTNADGTVLSKTLLANLGVSNPTCDGTAFLILRA